MAERVSARSGRERRTECRRERPASAAPASRARVEGDRISTTTTASESSTASSPGRGPRRKLASGSQTMASLTRTVMPAVNIWRGGPASRTAPDNARHAASPVLAWSARSGTMTSPEARSWRPSDRSTGRATNPSGPCTRPAPLEGTTRPAACRGAGGTGRPSWDRRPGPVRWRAGQARRPAAGSAWGRIPGRGAQEGLHHERRRRPPQDRRGRGLDHRATARSPSASSASSTSPASGRGPELLPISPRCLRGRPAGRRRRTIRGRPCSRAGRPRGGSSSCTSWR